MSRMIEGKVFDAETNEPLHFAVVAVTDSEGNPVQPVQSTQTFADGTFRMTIEGGEGTHIGAKFTGYPRMTKPIVGNTDFNFPLQAGYHLPEVVVTADKPEEKTIPNWMLWTGVAISVVGIGILIVSKTKN